MLQARVAQATLRNHAVVSITDPNAPRALFRDEGRLGVVRLRFADFGDDAQETLETYAKEGKFDMSTLFSTDQASQILDMVVPLVHPRCQVDAILVHCEAGISRSVGVARALERILPELDVEVSVANVFPLNQGNSRVRRLVTEEAIRRGLVAVPFASST